jgi:hypothetical protein
MNSQIPFEPVTPSALEKLTDEERRVFVSAAGTVCEGDARPSFSECVTLVEIISRLITAGVGTGFGDRYTVIPDSGVTELRCSSHSPEARRWPVGYHPSLDVLVEQARAHDLAEHSGGEPSRG